MPPDEEGNGIMRNTTQYADIPGWGVDRRKEERPGVPRIADPQHVIGAAPPDLSQRQENERASLVSPTLSLTPIYSSVVPPRGVSGAVRKLAYRYPEYLTRRWMLLLLADRIDVVEHNLPRTVGLIAAATAVGAGLFFLARRT